MSVFKRMFLTGFASCLLAVQTSAQNTATCTDSVFVEKTFPLANLIRYDLQVRQVIRNDSALNFYKSRQRNQLEQKAKRCNNLKCIAEAAKWSSNETREIGDRLEQLFPGNMKNFISEYKATGPYKIYQSCSDTAFIRNAWNDMSEGLNHILDVYVAGLPPRYSAIDRIDDSYTSDRFKQTLLDSMSAMLLREGSSPLFFDLSLNFSIQALQLNGRDEAVRYEPLNQGFNKAAFESIRHTEWKSYSYSMILVPGHGPDHAGIAIDSISKHRCQLAVKRYEDHLAPFIVVSGGHVHPNKTPFCEAVEMRKYLMTALHVPDSVILIEPHARHTTTNIRNVCRMVYRFGIPDTMKILTVTDNSQSSYILRMAQRSVKELGYSPFSGLRKVSENENEFYPVREALQPNPMDPLDP